MKIFAPYFLFLLLFTFSNSTCQAQQDSIPDEGHIITAASPIYDVSGFLRFLLGKNYREEWTQQFAIPIVYLDTLHGGLTPVKQGGGKQTKSLRLLDQQGRQYAMRSVNKNSTRSLPIELQKSFVSDIVQDAVSSAHPYGALIIPTLAEAASIYHVKPRLMYVPKQKTLGAFNDAFGDNLYLMEVRPNEIDEPLPNFGNSEKIVSSTTLFEKLQKSWQHRVDQHALLRARLFDLWLGDWDRHKDNWRWAVFKEDDLTIYRPIPRDRDKAFFRSDGMLGLIGGIPYFSPTLRNFDKKINYLPGVIFNAKHLDRANLNKLTQQEFIDIAKDLQKVLTNEIIEQAVKQLPPDIFHLKGLELIDILKTRRSDLQKYAEEYYLFLAKNIDIIGTEDEELFDIHQLADGKTRIKVFRLSKKGKVKGKMYERTFDPEETKEIALYGLQDRDSFVLSGEHLPYIKVRIIGGKGTDKVTHTFLKKEGKGKKLRIYDKPGKIELALPKKLYKDKISSDTFLNTYERYAFKYNKWLLYPFVTRTPDDGFRFSLNFINQTYQFKKVPYGSQNQFIVSYAEGSKALGITYRGHFPQRVGTWDFRFSLDWDGPIYLQNFFGLGNVRTPVPQPLSYYRLRGTKLFLSPTISKKFKERHYIEYGIQYQFFDIERTAGRFITDSLSDVPSNIFDPKYYVNAIGKYSFEQLDKKIFPGQGWRWEFNAGGYFNLLEDNIRHLRFDAQFSRYQPLIASKKIVWATHLGAAANIGNYALFHAAYLGSRSTLRGFFTNRYAGDAMVFHQNDLRFLLFQSTNNFMPTKMGMHLSFDYGRVWFGSSELDENWHVSYGGGIYFIPLDQVVLRFAAYIAESERVDENELRFSIIAGMAF